MPLPTASDGHVNAPLTNLSVAYVQDQKNYIADKVFPVVSVAKQSDRYFTYSKADLMRIEARERAPGAESAGGGWRLDNTPSYYARKYALHKDIDDDTRANSDSVIDMDRDAVEYLTQNMLMKRDKVFTANFLAASLWTGSVGIGGGADGEDLAGGSSSGSNQIKYWSASGSTPIDDIETQSIGMLKQTGYKPNTLVVGAEVWTKLKNHADFLDRIKYTQRGVVTEELVAQVLGLDRIVVAGAVENTAAEAQTATMAFITGKVALLAYVAPAPSLMKPSAGYIFGWSGLLGGSAYAPRIKKYRMDPLDSDRVEAEMAFDSKLVSADLGVFFSAAVV